jgi:hypothetical protein
MVPSKPICSTIRCAVRQVCVVALDSATPDGRLRTETPGAEDGAFVHSRAVLAYIAHCRYRIPRNHSSHWGLSISSREIRVSSGAKHADIEPPRMTSVSNCQ